MNDAKVRAEDQMISKMALTFLSAPLIFLMLAAAVIAV